VRTEITHPQQGRLRGVLMSLTKEHFRKQGLQPVFDKAFKGPEGFDKGIGTVLDSFFCSPREGGGQPTFEFKHKSFREFLTARRIVREVRELSKRLDFHPTPQDIDDALRRWLALCSPVVPDHGLADLVREEIRSHSADDVRDWMKVLTVLFSTCVHQGPPALSGEDMRARDAERRVRNAEIVLLVALDSCARALSQRGSRTVIEMNWPEDNTRDIVHRLIGPFSLSEPVRPRPPLTLECLSYFEFLYSQLDYLCLDLGAFEYTNFTSAVLVFSSLINANLWGAHFSSANLSRANLLGANLSRANLKSAQLWRATLSGADLSYASLYCADLTEANLSGANLSGAWLNGANLSGALLNGANLKDATLIDADLSDANLFLANLKGANLSGANLSGANLSGAILENSPEAGSIAQQPAKPVTS
jgi:hypothetical protein